MGVRLQDPALKAWHGSDQNLKDGARAIAQRARLNSAASLGAYTEEMETRRRITGTAAHAVNNRITASDTGSDHRQFMFR